jgi:TatD DNase family protein
MAPVPHRGERNESRLLPLVLQKLAEIHGVGEEDLAEITWQNACAAFGLQA